MAVETLYFMLRYRGIVQQVSNAVCTCEWVAIPSDRRRRAVEFWQVYGPRWRVVRGVIQTSELVCSAGRDFDAEGMSGAECEGNETDSYSSRVRVLILFESRGPDSETMTYLFQRVGYVIAKRRRDYPRTLTATLRG